MLQTVSFIRDISAEIWVADPNVEQVNDAQALQYTDIDMLRSVGGVEWAVPIYWGLTRLSFLDGRFFSQLLIH